MIWSFSTELIPNFIGSAARVAISSPTLVLCKRICALSVPSKLKLSLGLCADAAPSNLIILPLKNAVAVESEALLLSTCNIWVGLACPTPTNPASVMRTLSVEL